MKALAPASRAFWRPVAAASLVGLVILVTFEFTGVDLFLARLAYDPVVRGFPLREHVLTTLVAHDALKVASALAFAWILIGVWRPVGVLARLARPARLHLLLSVVVCLAVVAALKKASALHCPWGLVEFGGAHAYLRLFAPVPEGWSRGSCFPAGHALSAFAYIGGYFAWHGTDPRMARRWLVAVLLLGAVAGVSQQLRGAHFLSHTLWTLWLCWTIAAALAWLAGTRLRPVKANAASPG